MNCQNKINNDQTSAYNSTGKQVFFSPMVTPFLVNGRPIRVNTRNLNNFRGNKMAQHMTQQTSEEVSLKHACSRSESLSHAMTRSIHDDMSPSTSNPQSNECSPDFPAYSSSNDAAYNTNRGFNLSSGNYHREMAGAPVQALKPLKWTEPPKRFSGKMLSYSHINSPNGLYSFIVFDTPTALNVDAVAEGLKKSKVKTCVRTCEETYNALAMKQHGVEVVELFYPDGTTPSASIIQKWFTLVEGESQAGNPIAVHCVAGLGRSPLLVALVLVKYADMKADDAVALIRRKRRGAINSKQYDFVAKFAKSIEKDKMKAAKCGACTIM